MPWLDVVKQDINKLYWTESIVDIEAETIEGLCYILPAHKIQEDTAFEWTQKGLLRFCYSEIFDTKSRTLESMNEEAKNFDPPPLVCFLSVKFSPVITLLLFFFF